MTVKLKLIDSDDVDCPFLASQMYSPLSVSSTFLTTKVLLECGPSSVLVSRLVKEIFELPVSALHLSLVLLNQMMLAGGLAVTAHLIVTVSSSLGLSLSPLIDKLLKGTNSIGSRVIK